MSSSDAHNHRRSQTHQSIPLRDLHRPPDEHEEPVHTGASQQQRQHRRTLSDRGRQLLRHSGSLASGQPQYAPIAETSPSPTRTRSRPQIDTVAGASRHPPAVGEDGDFSPVDLGAFQDAVGFSGLAFQGETSPPMPTPMSSEQSYRQHSSDPYFGRSTSEDHGYFGASAYDEGDTARLTQNLQPISGAAPSLSPRAHDRSSFQSVRFLTPEGPPTEPALGHDLSHLENAPGGLRTSAGRKRSLSPGSIESPLHRAGTIMRNMSQRVVNISNEPEIAERTMRSRSSVRQSSLRQSTLRQDRLQEPPSFPALPSYLHDGPSSPLASPMEKPPSPIEMTKPSAQWQHPTNPFRGRSLGIFGPENKLRLWLSDLLVHPVTEPLLLVLIVVQTVLLAVDASKDVFEHPRSKEWGSGIDYALLGLFLVYTVEVIIRVIVSGFVINAPEYSTINRQIGFKQAVLGNARKLFAPQRQPSVKRADTSVDQQAPSVFRTFTTAQINPTIGTGTLSDQARARHAHRAYLRHSFNRTDFVAVVSFWISFLLGITGIEQSKHIYIFKMLSCLRIIRLLNLTSGTSVILRSLKKAAPLLVNVAFLISFFWLLFAIVGVQSFKSSFRRHCVWIDPEGKNNFTNSDQFCGGYLEDVPGFFPKPYIPAPGMPEGTDKGFLCPKGSWCVEGQNPYEGTQSFDNILQSIQLVFVIMTSNTYSDLLYTIADSDYLVGALFFAGGILILNLWLISLLIAVITSSFQIIREESKTSAFTGEHIEDEEAENLPEHRVSNLKKTYERTSGIWIFVISYGLICQALKSADMSESRAKFVDRSEIGVTFLLLLEIIIRFVIDWRHFFRSKQNMADLAIAIITSVIQIPAIKDSHHGRAYAWLSVFQIIRIYRVVLAVPMTRELIVRFNLRLRQLFTDCV